MNASLAPRAGRRSGIVRTEDHPVCAVEALEDRTLMSAAWTTTTLPTGTDSRELVSDPFGNIYKLSSYSATEIQERQAGSSAFTTIHPYDGTNGPKSMVTDSAGNLFVAMTRSAGIPNNSILQVYERRAGGTTFSPIGTPLTLIWQPGNAMATDSAGDIYLLANTLVNTTVKKTMTSTKYGMIQKLVPDPKSPTGYDESTVYRTANVTLSGVAVAGSGASSSVVVTDFNPNDLTNKWIVMRSPDGGASWTQVDSYRFDPSSGSTANAIAADRAGHVYIAGVGGKVGGSHWIVRKSSDSGATWTTDDDFSLSSPYGSDAYGIAIDPSGAVYVGGEGHYASNDLNSVVRTNAGGSWSTSLVKSTYHNPGEGDSRGYAVITSDSFGNIFANGYDDPVNLHELPAAPALLSAAPDPVQPSTQVNLSISNRGNPDITGYQLFRSTSGGGFTAIATLAANATSFSDSNLSPGTTYSYYLVSLLNQDGSSNPSDILSVTTDSSAT